MALTDLLASMESAAAAEEAAVLDAARAEATAILSVAEQTVAAARERLLREAAASARSGQAQLDAKVRIQIEGREAQSRDTMVERAFVRAAGILQTCRESQGYPSILEALLEVAEDEFPPDQGLIIRCDPRDLPAIQRLVAGRPRVVDPSLACWGGVQVADHTGSIVCDNTLEGRLQSARETLRWEVAALFLAPSHPDSQDTGSA